MRSSRSCVVAAVAAVLLVVESAMGGATSAELGLKLQALPEEELAGITQATGVRAGVMVVSVGSGSAASKAGLKAQDVILTVDTRPVDSPDAAERVMAASAGQVAIVGLRFGSDDDVQMVNATVAIPAGAAAGPASPADGATGGGAATGGSGGAQAADARARLQALEQARAAGVLTEDEYRQKKAALEAQLAPATPRIDPQTQQKLQALDAAKAAGVLSDQEYQAKRDALLKQAAIQGAAGPIVNAGDDTVLYQHALGISFRHLRTWTLKEVDGGVQLTPPNAAVGAQGPEEVYFIAGQSVAAEGIAAPDDPRLVQLMEGQVRQFLPALQRVGQTEQIQIAGGRGIILDWEAVGANGATARARAFITVLRGHALALMAIGVREKVAARDAELRRMFASFNTSEVKVDGNLAGRWTLTGTYALRNDSQFETDFSRAKMVSDNSTQVDLRPDGTWTKVVRSHMIAGAGTTWIESNDTKTTQGHWRAGDGTLHMVDDKGASAQYRYQFVPGQNGRQVQLAGQTGEIWTRQ
jgi:hypothetical protein